MTVSRSPAPNPDEVEVRLELTTAEVRQVWALYSRPPQANAPRPRPERGSPEAALGALLRELRPLAWRGRRTLALCSLAALALGLGFLLLATPTFGVRALVLVEPRGESAPDAAASRDLSAFLAGQAEILGGAAIVREALIETQLGTSGSAPGLFERLGAWLSRSAQPPEQAERAALARALGALSAAPVSGTAVIALEYRTQDPENGVRFVQAVIDGYGAIARELRSGEAGVRVQTLAPPTRQASPLWPRPAPVLFTCLLLGLLAGLARAFLEERAGGERSEWTEIREAAWAG